MDDLISEEKPISIQTTIRIGRTLCTVYKENLPIGSLLIDPEDLPFIMEPLNEFIISSNKRYREEAERKRIRSNERKSKRNPE